MHAILMDQLNRKMYGPSYEPQSMWGRLAKRIESSRPSIIKPDTTSEPNQSGSGLRMRRISRKKRVTKNKKRVSRKKKDGVHSRR